MKKKLSLIIVGLVVFGLLAACAPFSKSTSGDNGRSMTVSGTGAQLVEIARPHLRIARFQPFFVSDRLLLHELDRYGAALQIVEVEQVLRRAVAHDANKFVRDVHRVLDAAV